MGTLGGEDGVINIIEHFGASARQKSCFGIWFYR
jgi:hypothetical protein